MKTTFFILFTSFLSSHICFAQKQVMTFTNSKAIDEKRYEGILGSPFLFEDWKSASLTDKSDSLYLDIKLNYNGYEGDFEVLNGEEYISLDDWQFKNITIESDKGQFVFEKEMHQKFKDKLMLVIYKGTKITCFEDFSVGLTENKINGNMGATTITKRFKTDPMHYFIVKDELTSMRLSKNKLTAFLGNKKPINDFIKKNNLNIDDPFDLAMVLGYYENELL